MYGTGVQDGRRLKHRSCPPVQESKNPPLSSMLLLRLLQKLVRTLNSDGTPGQVAVGIALGSALGLTPLFNLHNLLIVAAVFLLNLSFPAAMLGWIFFAPIGFLFDPWFDAIGEALLADAAALVPMWTTLYNVPVVPLSNYNNTVVLGSLIGWLVLVVPIFLLARWGVGWYRAKILPRLLKTRLFKFVRASKLYNLFQLFQTD
jgi:uncharacterized protein (TIGR03546 family)